MEQIGLRLLIIGLPFSLLGIANMIVYSKMLDEVNERLPEPEQIEFFLRSPSKASRVRKLHRQFYPGDPLGRWELGLEVSMVLWFAVATWYFL